MYDSINIRLHNTLLDKYGNNQTIRSALTVEYMSISDKDIEYMGHIKNFAVFKKWDNLFLNGSVAKYKHGNNICHASLADAMFVIDDLSERLQMPVGQGTLSRLDVAFNLPVRIKPASYIHHLYQARGYPKFILYTHGKEFIQTQKKLVFYDKKKEMEKK